MTEIDIATLNLRYSNVSKLSESLQAPICFFDTETTALRGMSNFGIAEIAAVGISEKGILFARNDYINPEASFTPEALAVNKIDPAVLVDKEKWGDQYAAYFYELSENYWMVGFNNVPYDNPVIKDMNAKYSKPIPSFSKTFDIRPLFLHFTCATSLNGKLEDIARRLNCYRESHRALNDTLMTIEILDILIQVYGLEAISEFILTDKKSKLISPMNVAKYVAYRYSKTEKAVPVEQIAKKFKKDGPPTFAAVCTAIDERLLNPELVEQPQMQQIIAPALEVMPQKIKNAGNIMEVYNFLRTKEVLFDPVQVRVALLKKGISWKSLKP